MVAVDFIEEQKPVLDEEAGLTRYTNLELFTYLKRAYKRLQQDRPIFFKPLTIKSEKGISTYAIDDEVVDTSFLSVEDNVYQKVDISKFHEKCFSQSGGFFYAIELNNIHIYPTPLKDDLTISTTYARIKELKSLDSELLMPTLLEESLRLIFLSRAYEKVPARDDKNLALFYLRLYEKEIAKAKKASKHRYRGVRSNFQMI